MGNPITLQRLKEIDRRNSPDIVFLMETKNPTETVLEDLKWRYPEKYYAVPPHSTGGGVFLTWKPYIEVTIISATKNYIDTTISYKGLSYHTTFVYGEPDHTKRLEVWNEISKLNKSGPWFLTGDFNELIDNSEKCGGPDRAEGTFGAFRSFLSQNDLFDLKHSGSYLSWRGRRHSHLVQCRLDRSISNSDWTDLFPSCRSVYLRFEGSDHRPLISFLDTTRKRGLSIFRYDQRLKENQEVKLLVKATWEEFPYLQVEDRLSRVRHAICSWCKKHHENSKKSLESSRSSWMKLCRIPSRTKA